MFLRSVVQQCFLFTLSDVNECDLGEDDCEQTCVNEQGSYSCGCSPGFKVNEDDDTKCDGEQFHHFCHSSADCTTDNRLKFVCWCSTISN